MVAGVKLSNEEVIARFIDKHGDRYDYSKTEYVNYTTLVTVTCKKHGDFTISPYSHWEGRGNCPSCHDGKVVKGDKDWFIKKSILAHGDRYNYDKSVYVTSATKVTITCHVHGDFSCVASSHMGGVGCPHCAGKYFGIIGGAEKANKLFSEKVQHINPDYEVVSQYRGSLKPVTVRHKVCGCESEVFAATLGSRKISCQKCERVYFDSEAVTILYYVEIFNKLEKYYKIGLTQRSNLHKRFTGTGKLPESYEYKALYTNISNGKEAREKEQEILKTFKEYGGHPEEKFGGYTECFSTDISKLHGFFDIFNRP